MTRVYNDYCPVAHTLEIIGERWSLLIIRDLLRQPQRFTELLRSSSHITAKWLTLRLRKLEEAGIIEREKRQDQREVWYKLTPAGRELRPVVEALWAWGLRYAMKPPLPGEVVRPEMAMATLVTSLNKRSKKLSQPATWQFHFTDGSSYNLSFDGDYWSVSEGEKDSPDVSVVTSPEAWVTLLTVKRNERIQLVKTIPIAGVPERVEEFLYILGARNEITPAGSKP